MIGIGVVCISRNKGITMSGIESHMELPWNWGCMSRNPNVRIYDIEKHSDKPWDWYQLDNSTIFNPDEYVDQWLLVCMMKIMIVERNVWIMKM